MNSPSSAWPVAHSASVANGLEVVVVPLPHLSTASIVLFVRIGSRYETAEINGLSHLLEHVLYRGCLAYPDTFSLNTAIEGVAAGLDAATSRDFTTFEAACLPERVGDVLGLLGAMLTKPLIRDADVAIEQRIIHEELQDELDAKGRDIDIDNLSKSALFGESSLGLKVGGELARVRRFTAEQCRRWHDRFYGAANMVLVVTGPVEADAIAEITNVAFADLPRGTRQEPLLTTLQAELPAFHFTFHEGTQADVQLQWCLPAEDHEDWPALFMAQRLLDDGTCARLRHRIVDQLGLAYHASADLESYEGLSVMSLHTQTRPQQILAAVDAIQDLLEDLASTPAPAAELSRVHTRLLIERAAVRDSASSIAYWFGIERLFPRLDGLPRRLERAFAVTAADIAAATAKHLKRGALLLSVVGDVEPITRAALRRRVNVGRSALSAGA